MAASASLSPSVSPSVSPSSSPSASPSVSPSRSPSVSPSASPSASPSVSPSPLPEGAVTYTVHSPRNRLGKKHFNFVKIEFGANANQAYPSGGIPVSESGLGMVSNVDAIIFLESNANVYLYEYDVSANTIRIFSQARVEVSAGEILPDTDLEVLAIGW